MTKEKIIKLVSLFNSGEDVPDRALQFAEGFKARNTVRNTTSLFDWTVMKICHVTHPVAGKQRILRLELYPIKKEHLLHFSDRSVLGQRLVIDVNLEKNPQWNVHEVITDIPKTRTSQCMVSNPVTPASIPDSNFESAFSDDTKFGKRL